jgi:hypothetical protein
VMIKISVNINNININNIVSINNNLY